jgi:DNA excision repair protein ERCC-2
VRVHGAARRESDYESEITLAGTHRTLSVRGRADGYDGVLNQLEEVKTYRGDLEAMPGNHRVCCTGPRRSSMDTCCVRRAG